MPIVVADTHGFLVDGRVPRGRERYGFLRTTIACREDGYSCRAAGATEYREAQLPADSGAGAELRPRNRSLCHCSSHEGYVHFLGILLQHPPCTEAWRHGSHGLFNNLYPPYWQTALIAVVKCRHHLFLQ